MPVISYDAMGALQIVTIVITAIIIPMVWRIKTDVCHRVDRIEDRLQRHFDGGEK